MRLRLPPANSPRIQPVSCLPTPNASATERGWPTKCWQQQQHRLVRQPRLAAACNAASCRAFVGVNVCNCMQQLACWKTRSPLCCRGQQNQQGLDPWPPSLHWVCCCGAIALFFGVPALAGSAPPARLRRRCQGICGRAAAPHRLPVPRQHGRSWAVYQCGPWVSVSVDACAALAPPSITPWSSVHAGGDL